MRCPKCHYLSFDPEPRCKNCGYDLEVDDADLALRTSERQDATVPDLTLHARPGRSAVDEVPMTLELAHAGPRRETRARKLSAIARERDVYVDPVVDDPEVNDPDVYDPDVHDDLRVVDVNDDVVDVPDIRHPDDEPNNEDKEVDDEIAAAGPFHMFTPSQPVAPEPDPKPAPPPAAVTDAPRPAPFRSAHTTTDMPLFVKGLAGREDLLSPDPAPTSDLDEGESHSMFVTQTVVPAARTPLAVRRTAPDGRARQKPVERRLESLDDYLLADLTRVEREEAFQAREESPAVDHGEHAGECVEPSQRAAAAAIDVAVLGGIAGFVLWATLRLCNVSLWDLSLSALVPLVLFLALMDVGYLLLFTAAGGQTVGKMWMGLRVVGEPADPGHHIPLGQAAFRSALTLVSVVGLGLGWVPALFGRGLALHDRVTHTRVVRV